LKEINMPDDRLIVALDVPNVITGLELVKQLDTSVSFYKIGLGMLTSGGLALANELKAEYGKRIFLDMKLFDISTTIEAAVKGISKFDIDFLTVHGDPSVVAAAKNGAADSNLKILAVTILTSLDRQDLDDSMIKDGEVTDLVSERASRAFEAGADGVIASPQESRAIRKLSNSRNKLIVTPGIRPKGAESGDQKRVSTPFEAILNGANHIVVGRPIVAAENKRLAAEKILEEIKSV
jgi:orotidine-5'-phosphate decarboxylase